ncbi:MAG: hypothetical protein RLZZ232_3004, partial [Planctomycetota bacterium]
KTRRLRGGKTGASHPHTRSLNRGRPSVGNSIPILVPPRWCHAPVAAWHDSQSVRIDGWVAPSAPRVQNCPECPGKSRGSRPDDATCCPRIEFTVTNQRPDCFRRRQAARASPPTPSAHVEGSGTDAAERLLMLTLVVMKAAETI